MSELVKLVKLTCENGHELVITIITSIEEGDDTIAPEDMTHPKLKGMSVGDATICCPDCGSIKVSCQIISNN